MNKITRLLLTVVSVLLMAGNAMALSFTQDYWTPTDLTTGNNGSVVTWITLENASYESSFGFYTVNDAMNAIVSEFTVFQPSSEVGALADIYFKQDAGLTYVQLNTDAGAWTLFDDTFGFFFNVSNTGKKYYTDIQFNTDGVEHIGTVFTSPDKFEAHLEDIYGGGDRDYDDMVIKGRDLAPIPEPATMMLLGLGLLGLAGVSRKRR